MAVHLRVRRPRGPSNSRFITPGININKNELSRKVQREILAGIEIGLPAQRAAELAGIGYKTYSKWFDRGRKENAGKYFRLYKAIITCSRNREKESLEVIRKCGKGGYEVTKTKIKTSGEGNKKKTEVERTVKQINPQWQAAAWYLERLYKETYGREASIDDSTPEERAREINDLVKAMDLTVPSNGS